MIDAQLHIHCPGDDPELADDTCYHATITGVIGQGRVAIYYNPATNNTKLIHIDKDVKSQTVINPDWKTFFELMSKTGFTDE